MEQQKAGLPQALIIIAIGLLPMMAIVALMPVVPAIRENFKDIPNILTLAPLVLSAPGLCVALFSPYAGYLTDKLGRRKLLLIFTLLYGVGGILPFFFGNFPSLMGGRLILGIGEAFILTIGNTLLGDYFQEKDRAKWLMWQSIVGSGCGTLLLWTSGNLSRFGWNYPFLVYSFALLITLGAFFFVYEPQRKTETSNPIAGDTAVFPIRIMVQMALTTLVAATLYFVYTLHFSLALDGLGVKDRQQIGNYSAIASVAVPIGGLLFRLIAHKSSQFQFACLFALIGIGLIGIGLGWSIETVVASAWLQQLGGGMAIPILISWGLSHVPPEFRGRGMGFWTSGFFLGQFISPLIVSAVRGITGSLLSAFIVLGAVCLGMAAYNWWSGKKVQAVQ